MRTLGRALLIAVILGALVAALILADQAVRRRAERQVSAAIVEQFGGEVVTELGGWPFSLTLLTNRLEDARITVTNASVAVGDRQATIDRAEFTAVGLTPVDDLARARAERVDAEVHLTWGQLTTLVGFPVSHAGGDRISARTSVEVFGVVAVIELRAGLSIAPDGKLALREPTASAVGIDLPRQVIQFAVDALAPQLALPVLNGLSYEGLAIGPDGIGARLHGTDVAIGELR